MHKFLDKPKVIRTNQEMIITGLLTDNYGWITSPVFIDAECCFTITIPLQLSMYKYTSSGLRMEILLLICLEYVAISL